MGTVSGVINVKNQDNRSHSTDFTCIIKKLFCEFSHASVANFSKTARQISSKPVRKVDTLTGFINLENEDEQSHSVDSILKERKRA